MMLIFEFIQRQVDTNREYARQLRQVSVNMQLEHPRGRFKYYQRELESLNWQLQYCRISMFMAYFPSTVARLKIREKVLKKNMEHCREEMRAAQKSDW